MSQRPFSPVLRVAALAGIGALGWAIVRWSAGTSTGGVWTVPSVVLTGLVVGLGALEVATIRATGRRRAFASWLPAALGLAAAIAIDDMTGPVMPDAGVARSIAVATVLVASAAMAMGVHLIAGIARVVGGTSPTK